MPGFPNRMFRRRIFPLTPGATKIPFMFPTAVFSSTIFPVSAGLGRPIPKLLPCDANPFPISRFTRSRLPVEPAIHIPPQAAPGDPFRMEVLCSTRWPDPPVKIMPELQLVEEITSVTVEPVLVRSWIPWLRNC